MIEKCMKDEQEEREEEIYFFKSKYYYSVKNWMYTLLIKVYKITYTFYVWF